MNNRLQQFLAAENITQSVFAESIGVTKASVSHILGGRNKPGFEFIESMARRYPNLNIEWLISGKGKMYKNQGEQSLFQQESDEFLPQPLPEETPAASRIVSDSLPPEIRKSAAAEEEPRISKILVFYDNGTYKEIK